MLLREYVWYGEEGGLMQAGNTFNNKGEKC